MSDGEKQFTYTVNTQDDETELMALLAQVMQSYKDIGQEGRARVVHWFLDRYSPVYSIALSGPPPVSVQR